MTVEAFDDNNDFGADGLSAVRRQTSPANAKGRSRRSGGRKRRIVLACAVLAAVAAAFYFVARFALNDPHFRTASLQIQGGKYVTAAEVEEKFSADQDKNVLRVPLERRRRQIEQIPWVRAAAVRRVLPNQIVVTVSERVPVAFLAKEDGLFLVDEEGVVLDAPKDGAFRFPVVRGIAEDEPAATRREKMRLFSALMKDLQRGGMQSNETISEVDLQNPQDARMVLSDSSGTVLLHLGKENFMARYLIYLSHIEEWKQKFPNIQSIDLRYEGQVVVNADPQRELKTQPKAATPSASQSAGKTQPR